MKVTYEEGKRFYKLYAALLSYVNDKLKIIRESFPDMTSYTALSYEKRFELRNALFEHRELIDQFVEENPANLSDQELEIVKSWNHALVGKFYVFRYLSNYTVFLSETPPAKAYGVLALADSFEDMFGSEIPRYVETVLLPLDGKIIYDGIFMVTEIYFGPGYRRDLNETYKEAKEAFGIITSLPESAAPAGTAAKTPSKQSKKAQKAASGSSDKAKAVHENIVALLDAFCRDHLNEEYAELCRRLAGVLARKRPSPLLQGKPEGWAAGIVRAIGMVNFLNDPHQTPHKKMSEIDTAFGISEATGSAKSMAIRKLLKMRQFDPDWTVPSMMDQNPLIWMLQVNGLMMDIRDLPREAQVVAFEKGLIPYIPADQEETGE
jgi:hypothetical protein